MYIFEMDCYMFIDKICKATLKYLENTGSHIFVFFNMEEKWFWTKYKSERVL